MFEAKILERTYKVNGRRNVMKIEEILTKTTCKKVRESMVGDSTGYIIDICVHGTKDDLALLEWLIENESIGYVKYYGV